MSVRRASGGVGWLGLVLAAAGCDATIGEANPGADAAGVDAAVRATPDAATSQAPDDASAPDAAPVVGLPPVAAFGVFPAAGTQETSFSFDASASRASDASGLALSWDFDGDGVFDDEGEAPTHTFSSDGLKTVTLRATDEAGLASYASASVLVSPAAERVVVTTAEDVADPDDGETSLREAIAEANEEGPHTIAFAEPMTIELASALPAVTDNATSIVGGDGVTIDGGGQVGDCLDLTSDGNRVMWLEVRDCTDDGVDFGSGRGNVIAHCHVHGHGDDGIDTDGGADNFVGPGNTLVANEKNAVEVKGDGMTVRGNEMNGHVGAGVSIESGATTPTIAFNVIAQNGAGIAVDGSISGTVLHHNTIAANRGDGLAIGPTEGSADHDVRNNLFTHNRGLGIRTTGTFAAIDHNGYYENGEGDCDACPDEPNSKRLDPLYAGALAGDFRLDPQSPYIDAAGELGYDVNGAAPGDFGGSAPDVGAEESP